jgi:hypothetical protein
VAHPARAEDDDPPVETGHRLGQDLAEAEVVLGVRGLADAGRHPALVALEVLEQVDGGVVDGEVGVVAGQDPRVVTAGGHRLHGAGQLGVARRVVGHAGDDRRQLLGGEPAGPALVGGEDVLLGRRPVRVHDDDRVGSEAVEDLGPEPGQAVDQGRVDAVVQQDPTVGGDHDRRHVGHHTRSDDLPHGASRRWSFGAKLPHGGRR